MGVVNKDAAPTENKTSREIEFDILNKLCNRFMSLSPLEVINADLEDILYLYVNCIIYDQKNNKQTNKEVEWVTSKNATWH